MDQFSLYRVDMNTDECKEELHIWLGGNLMYQIASQPDVNKFDSAD